MATLQGSAAMLAGAMVIVVLASLLTGMCLDCIFKPNYCLCRLNNAIVMVHSCILTFFLFGEAEFSFPNNQSMFMFPECCGFDRRTRALSGVRVCIEFGNHFFLLFNKRSVFIQRLDKAILRNYSYK